MSVHRALAMRKQNRKKRENNGPLMERRENNINLFKSNFVRGIDVISMRMWCDHAMRCTYRS